MFNLFRFQVLYSTCNITNVHSNCQFISFQATSCVQRKKRNEIFSQKYCPLILIIFFGSANANEHLWRSLYFQYIAYMHVCTAHRTSVQFPWQLHKCGKINAEIILFKIKYLCKREHLNGWNRRQLSKGCTQMALFLFLDFITHLMKCCGHIGFVTFSLMGFSWILYYDRKNSMK